MPAFANIDYIHDGNFTGPVPVDPPLWEYPFLNNGDTVSAHFEQSYIQKRSTFIPATLKIAHPDYTDFYLVEETQPVDWLPGSQLVKFTRTWSRVPEEQTELGSRFITKPNLPGSFPQRSGNSIIVQPEESVPRWVFYSRQAVTTDSGSPGTGGLITGGAYSVTSGADTTSAVAYNASATTLSTALNLLASITAKGGVTVTGTYATQFTITWAAPNAATINAAGLTVASGTPTGTNPSGAVWTQFLYIQTSTLGNITGGTFTITIFGQTTSAINYDASLATIITALNALSNVTARGGVSGNSYAIQSNQISFTFSLALPALLSVGVTGLIPPSSTGAVTRVVSALPVQKIVFTGGTTVARTFTSVAHGIVAGDDIVVLIGTSYFTIESGLFTVVDVDNISITALAGNAYTAGGAATFIGKAGGTSYTGGSKLTRVKRITTYYLPGVTPNIATADDIPLPAYEGDSVSLLAAIFAGTTEINYEVGEQEFYRNGPIVQVTVTTLDASTL